ncbi:MAG: hypothetical protein R3B64_00825 [Candidatus Paceibacterota bacterium]
MKILKKILEDINMSQMRSFERQSFADGFGFSIQKMGTESIICLPYYHYRSLKEGEILDYFLAELELHGVNTDTWLKENLDTSLDLMGFNLYAEKIEKPDFYPGQPVIFIRRRDWGISWDYDQQFSRSFDE